MTEIHPNEAASLFSIPGAELHNAFTVGLIDGEANRRYDGTIVKLTCLYLESVTTYARYRHHFRAIFTNETQEKP